MNIEELIFSNLIFNEEYARKVLAYLNIDYFKEHAHKECLKLIFKYSKTYNKIPSKEIMLLELKNHKLHEEIFNETKKFIENLSEPKERNIQWLFDKTEEFCQEKSMYNAVVQSFMIISRRR